MAACGERFLFLWFERGVSFFPLPRNWWGTVIGELCDKVGVDQVAGDGAHLEANEESRVGDGTEGSQAAREQDPCVDRDVCQETERKLRVVCQEARRKGIYLCM